MRLVLSHEAIFGPWVEQRIPHLFLDTLGPFVAIGIVDDSDLVRGAALFHSYAPRYRGIEMSFVLESPRYLSKSVIAGIMAYPFDQLGVLRVSAVTPRSSASARRFLETFGFKREGLARSGFGDFGDAVIYGLTPKDWSQSRFNARRLVDGQEEHAGGARRA